MKDFFKIIKGYVFPVFCTVLILAFPSSLFAQADEERGVERYAIFVGSNSGGRNNQRLLYAGTDAISFQKTMAEIGGIPASNGILLLDPAKSDLDGAIQTVTEMLKQNKQHSKRSEFIFYYSGHSDENSLLLGRSSYGYSELKAAITDIPSDVHVVILDSCYSGNFIRTKGGQRKKPFLLDDSTVVKGHAYLSSSSSQEFSQESDEIGSSFFTNAMLTGLRGAADSSGDKKVTLNELYSYAFNETLSKTENSSAGPQHPNYNITLVGSGDLVLSDISNSDSIVLLSSALQGRVLIRYKNGKLLSEINKISGTPVYLALEKGEYKASVIQEGKTLQGSFSLGAGKVYELSDNSLSAVAGTTNRLRGEEKEENNDDSPDQKEFSEDEIFIPFELSFVMNEISRGFGKKVTTPFSLSLLHSDVYRVNGIMVSAGINEADFMKGIQAAGIGNFSNELKGIQAAGVFNMGKSFNGVQAAGVFNMAEDFIGIQTAGVFNIAKNTRGIQTASIFNIADSVTGLQCSGLFSKAKTVYGVQLGLVNIAEEVHGVQLGIINISNDGILEIGTSFTSNRNTRLVLNSGKRYLYAIAGASFSGRYMFDNYDGDRQINFFYGVGTRSQLNIFNFDFEAIRLVENSSEDNSFNVNFLRLFIPSFRTSFGISPVKHLNIFAAAMFACDYGESSRVYEKLEKNLSISFGNNFKIYPEFDVGVKYCIK